MNELMRSSVMGLLLGQFSSPLPMAQKEPVAYLYNGVRLPALPEWDREKFPYALIKTEKEVPELCLFSQNNGWEIRNMGSYTYPALNVGGSRVVFHKYPLTDGAWEVSEYNFIGYITLGGHSATTPTYQVWTNVDIVSADTGELLMSASDPIPVYE